MPTFTQTCRHATQLALLVLSLSWLAACGGGGSSASSGGSVANSAASAATASSAVSQASSSRASSSLSSSRQSSSSAASSTVSTSLYSVLPDVATCAPGQLNDSERSAVLAKLNEIRARHGLPAVSYDSSYDSAAAEAAMYMVANKLLTHAPDSSGLCYTSNAYALASTSNLYLYTSSASTQGIASSDSVVGYLIDDSVSSLGHRRWILYPFLNKTTYGRVDGQPSGSTTQYMASALKVIGNEASSVSMNNDFVAYPYGNYPASEFSTSWYLSFSVVASKTSIYSNGSSQVSFANASISVTDPSSNALSISAQAASYDGYGLANVLQWKVGGLQTGTTYTVTISNVVVNGSARNFSYTFTLN